LKNAKLAATRHYMFVRFRSYTSAAMQVSIVETRRTGGKVRHEHVAGLGSIEMPPTVSGRVAFWRALHERLGRLGNRLDPETQARLLGSVHERIPMVTPDEQRILQRETPQAVASSAPRGDRAAGRR
jgi:hypothetical protein